MSNSDHSKTPYQLAWELRKKEAEKQTKKVEKDAEKIEKKK